MRNAICAILVACALTAQTVDRTHPPQTPPIPGYKLPPIQEAKLRNGLAVVLVEDSRFPFVTARLSFRAGDRYDPKDLPGLSETTASLLIEGTATRTSRQIAEELAAMGGSLSGVSGPDGLTLAGGALAENLPRLLALAADVARNATFPDEEVRLRIQNRKQELLAQRSEPSFLAEEKLNAVVFGDSPYAHIAPTAESLDRINRKLISDFRDRRLAPNNAILILLGKLPQQAEVMKLVEQQFGAWEPKQLPASLAAQPPPGKRELLLVDRPGSVQADIHVGKLAVTRASPDYFPLMVGSVILGGGASSRMFANIREKQGFAYDAHSELDLKKDAGMFVAVTQVRNDVVEPAMKAVLDELGGMAKDRVSPEELSDAKNFVSGIYLLRLETQSGLADQLNMMKVTGLPNEYLEKYTLRVRAVEPDQIQAAARKYIAPGDAAIVVVGDAAKIQKPLEKYGKVTVTKSN
jgi:predicted Zn-dependent peptidase